MLSCRSHVSLWPPAEPTWEDGLKKGGTPPSRRPNIIHRIPLLAPGNSPYGPRRNGSLKRGKGLPKVIKQRDGLGMGGGVRGNPSLPLETGCEEVTFPRVLISPVFPSPGLGTDRKALGSSHGQGFNLASPPQNMPCPRAAGFSAIS